MTSPSGTSGSRSPECITSVTNLRLAPSDPPGWKTLKSWAVKPLASSKAIARQSPMASCMVVEVVGAKPCGQASLARGSSSTTSDCLAERRVRARGDGDQRHLEPARVGQDIAELDALARPRDGDDGIVARDHAEVAVARLARVHEEGRRPRGGEGGGDLLPDVSALADAGDDHAAPGGGQHRNSRAEGLFQILVQVCPQRLQALALEVERARRRQGRVRTGSRRCVHDPQPSLGACCWHHPRP